MGGATLFPSANSAVISACGTYRYRLVRDLGGGRTLVVCMANPSTATAETNDPTIRRVIAFARAWGFGRVIVVNLCAFRATDVRELARAADPIGPENDTHILTAAGEADMIVAAWGVRSKLPPALRGRCDVVLSLLADRDVYCIRRTSGGDPEHPLFLPRDTQPALYRAMLVTAAPLLAADTPEATDPARQAVPMTEQKREEKLQDSNQREEG